MKLNRYLAVLYTGSVGLSLVCLVMLVVAAQFLEGASSFRPERGGASAALELALLVGLEYGFQILPVAVFLGALVAGTVLARRGELLAMQAGGMSTLRQALPMGFVVCMITLGAVWVGDAWMPRALERAEMIRLEKLNKASPLHRFFSRRAHWFHHDDLMLHLPVIDRASGGFRGPTVYRVEQGSIIEVMTARTLTYSQAGWVLSLVERFEPGVREPVRYDVYPLKLNVEPGDLVGVAGNPKHLNRSDIQTLIERRERAGMEVTAHQLELHQRLSLPLASIWMFLLALPWALLPDRRRSMAIVLGAGVVAVAVLLSGMHIFRMLALSEQLSAFWGCWGVGVLGLSAVPINQILVNRYRQRGTVF
ncbi:MAG: LptF/LptG family permease [Myxococcota bacterium]|nr:LptF/LptG family permease [Myxococcota bacterium]